MAFCARWRTWGLANGRQVVAIAVAAVARLAPHATVTCCRFCRGSVWVLLRCLRRTRCGGETNSPPGRSDVVRRLVTRRWLSDGIHSSSVRISMSTGSTGGYGARDEPPAGVEISSMNQSWCSIRNSRTSWLSWCSGGDSSCAGCESRAGRKITARSGVG